THGRLPGGRLCLDCFVVPPRNDESSCPVIANAVKQSRHRRCSPGGCRVIACAWIASFPANDDVLLYAH
ncbi:MAG: hypothetical protein LBJ47_00735, partial [Tannerella sp.]|nr:hypothetical protein [Tannerella sp.]